MVRVACFVVGAMPAPKPIERKRLNGRTADTDSGGRKLPAPIVVSKAELDARPIPVAPVELGRRGQIEWERIWSAGFWLHPDEDYHWLVMIAQAYDDIDSFRRKVKKDGLIQSGSQGQVIAHPLLAEIRKAEAVIQKSLSALGFSPSDRARLGLAEVKQQSALEELMAKRNARASKPNGAN